MSTANEAPARRQSLATVVEAADFLNVSRATVYAEMERGNLAWIKVAGCRRIRWSDLDAYVAKNSHGAA
ncbi:MAG: helix-turn-helix domain-containing protein [Pirellulales bacterium]